MGVKAPDSSCMLAVQPGLGSNPPRTVTDSEGVPDRDLLAAGAAGDRAAFERLYLRHERRVYQYVLSIIRDRQAAEEVVVDSMTSVWKDAGRFAGNSRVSTWILGIARHKALDVLRKRARRGVEMPLDEAHDLATEQESPVDAVDRVSSASLARRAMAQLSAEHQEILRLAFFEELAYDEIASLLSIPANTVKTRVYYAKQQFRHFVEKLSGRERGR